MSAAREDRPCQRRRGERAYLACASSRCGATCALVGVTSFRGLSCQTHVGRPRWPDILPRCERKKTRRCEDAGQRDRGTERRTRGREQPTGKRREKSFLRVCRKGKQPGRDKAA